jgi:hypothetical protein
MLENKKILSRAFPLIAAMPIMTACERSSAITKENIVGDDVNGELSCVSITGEKVRFDMVGPHGSRLRVKDIDGAADIKPYEGWSCTFPNGEEKPLFNQP